MSANNAFHIAVLAGDGIGPEVMAPAIQVLRKIEQKSDLRFRFTEAPAGANNYLATGKSMPESTIKLCEEADAILLGACGLPSVRYPDNTEIAPQIELRFIFDLYAGVRPARLIPGVPSPIVGADTRGIDLVVIRESTEGLFASMGKGVVTHEDARETMVITRRTSERLFEFSFRLAARRKARGKPGMLTCVDKANVFKAFAFFRGIFDEIAKKHPEVKTDRLYVDACSAMLVKRPWDFDVMVMENMFGDIVSDITASLIGGLGMAPSADIGDKYAVFQPCHGTAPDIMGQGKANPTGMILSAAMMLDWIADKHGVESAAEAGETIERAVRSMPAASSRWSSAAATARPTSRRRCWGRCSQMPRERGLAAPSSFTSGASGGDPSPMGAGRHSTGAGHRNSHRRHNSSDATSSGPTDYRPFGPDRRWRPGCLRRDRPAECRSASPRALALTSAQRCRARPDQAQQT
ncbi:3-isopropylmalate dehydrogenase [Bradyrhizobium diazoefficiens]